MLRAVCDVEKDWEGGGSLRTEDVCAKDVFYALSRIVSNFRAAAPASTAGALVSTMFDANSGDPNYLEACVRFYPNGQSDPVFLSSGTEDFFLRKVLPCNAALCSL